MGRDREGQLGPDPRRLHLRKRYLCRQPVVSASEIGSPSGSRQTALSDPAVYLRGHAAEALAESVAKG
jgi:hypothetical protein